MSLQEQLDAALQTFDHNLDSVRRLMEFDTHVLEFVEHNLESLNERLLAIHGENSRLNVSNTLALLRNIRKADSLEPYYRAMLNHCVVLLASYFSSAVADIFRAGVVDAVNVGRRRTLLEEEIKISLEMLPAIQVGRAGDLLLASSREINLQNMPSIAKTFGKYFNFKRPKDDVINDIIVAHECRHVIVHCGGVADDKLVSELESARPRTLKATVARGEQVQFKDDEILRVADCMKVYLQDLVVAVAQ